MNISIQALAQAILGGRKHWLKDRKRNNDKAHGKRKAHNTFKGICGAGNKQRRFQVALAAQSK